MWGTGVLSFEISALVFTSVMINRQGAFNFLSDFTKCSVGFPLKLRKNRNLSLSLIVCKQALSSNDSSEDISVEVKSLDTSIILCKV